MLLPHRIRQISQRVVYVSKVVSYNIAKQFTTLGFPPLHQWPIESKLIVGIEENSLESIIDRSNILWKRYSLSNMTPTVTIEYAEAQKGDEIMDFCIHHNLPEAFGIVSWESSHTILSYLHKQIQTNMNIKHEAPIVCDVGCGTGLVLAVALLYGAKKVIALDYNIFALSFARRTLQRNVALFPICDNREAIKLIQFDLSELSQNLPHADIYTFSDILYTESLARLVAQRIRGLLMASPERDCHCIVSDPKRTTVKFFLEELGFVEAVNMLSDSHRLNDVYSTTVNKLQLRWVQSPDRHIFQLSSPVN